MNIVSTQPGDSNIKRMLKSLIALSVPLIIGELGSIAQQFADTIMVGHHTTDELSAAAMVNNIFYFVIYFVLGISYAVTPLVGNAFGRGDRKGTIKILLEGCILNLLIGAVSVLGLSVILGNIDRFGQSDDVLLILPYAEPYFILLMISIPFLTVFLGLKQYLDGMSRTSVSMWIMLCSNIINILLNWMLIFGRCGLPEMGLTGAGISTLITRVLQLLVLFLFVIHDVRKERKKLDFERKEIRPEWSGIFKQFKLGLPIGIQLSLELSIFTACAIFMGWLGKNELAAHQEMYTISTLCFQILYGIGAANCIMVSQFRGAGDMTSAKKCSRISFFFSLTLITILTLSIVVCFDQLSSFMTPNIEVRRYMQAILPGFVLYQLGDCLQCTYGNALRGIEATKPLMLYSFIAYVLICIPLSAILGNENVLGAWGVWLGAPVGLTLAGTLFMINFKKRIKLQQNELN